jgi:amino acid adenylation domain-containing protein
MPLHVKFELNAKLYPNKTAIIFKDQKITYEQLNYAANNLATSLSNENVRFGDIVPILLNRTPELIVSIIAVLKIGAIYTLVDIHSNEEKVETLINFLAPNLLITKDNFFSYQKNIKKKIFPELNYNNAGNFIPSSNIDGDSAACIFFTSGSTGNPKAVLSSHNATLRLFIDASILDFSNKTIIPLAAAVPWDAFSLELWGALVNGGTLWIIDDLYLTSNLLYQGILYHNVNTIWLTSSLFNSIVEEDIESFRGLKYVITGGERLSVHHVKTFLSYYQHEIVLINGYGPVESTIFTTNHKIHIEDCNNCNGIPIGSVIPGTEVFILNKNYDICDGGEIGEICIAGDGLAIEYFNNKELTNQKFKLIEINGQKKRIYCSGDLGFFTNKILHYYNRKDRQVKILGHRIDLGEVERKIQKIIEEIVSCRLLVRQDGSNISSEIIAFYILRDSKSLDGAYIIKTLNETLETYECPKVINQIEKFPLTSRGKVDDFALLNILSSIEKNSVAKLPNQYINNDFETNIVKIFSSVTGRAFINKSTNFQELGISSIDIGRICTRLNKLLGLQIPISIMYKYNTILLLSNYLITESNTNNKQTNLNNLRDTQIIYLTKYLMNPSIPIYYCFMTWKITGDLDIEKLQNAINYTHIKNIALRSIYSLEKSLPTTCTSYIAPPQILYLADVSSEKQALLTLKNTLSKGLNPISGIIWKTAIVSLKNTKTKLFGCVVHHIAFDGYSEHLIALSISNEYNAETKIKVNNSKLDTPIIFRNPTIKNFYNTFEDLDSLSKKLNKCVEIKWSDHGLPKNDNSHYYKSFNLDKLLRLHIDKFATKNNTTRFNILLHYWAKTLYELLINKDFCIAVPIRQRNIPTLKKLIGCHINMIYIYFGSNCFDYDDYHNLQYTNSAIRDAMLTQDIPAIQVIQNMQTYGYNTTKMSQILFALQDNPVPKLQLKNLQTDFLRQPYFNIPFDLHAEIWPIDKNSLKLMVSYKKIIPEELINKIVKKFIGYLNSLKVK